MGFCCCLLNKSPKRVDKARPAYLCIKIILRCQGLFRILAHALTIITTNAKIKVGSRGWLELYPSPLFPSRAAFWPLLAGFEARQPLLNPWQGQGRKKKTHHRNHQPHHSTHQPRPAALGWAPSHPARLTRPPTDQKDRLSTRTHLFRPPRRAAGRACRAARLGRGSGSCTRNRAGGGPRVGSWLGFAP